MNHTSEGLKKSTLVISAVIMGSFCLTALGGILELPLLVYFWYLALLGMAAMVALTGVSAVAWLLHTLSRRYRHI